jgi:hypothetical protein
MKKTVKYTNYPEPTANFTKREKKNFENFENFGKFFKVLTDDGKVTTKAS